MVKRKADELIRKFILNDKRSLLVTGARQVGWRPFVYILSSVECLRLFKGSLTLTISAECMKNSVESFAPIKGTSPNMTMAISCR